MEKKTSKEWLQLVSKEFKLKILDPDGWDRSNFDYSFNQELITKNEFLSKLAFSTINGDIKMFEMKKEIKIEDFIDSKELESMTEKEREIYEKTFELNKNKLQELTDANNIMNEIKNKLDEK
jgi:hypothetical protein